MPLLMPHAHGVMPYRNTHRFSSRGAWDWEIMQSLHCPGAYMHRIWTVNASQHKIKICLYISLRTKIHCQTYDLAIVKIRSLIII